MCRGVGSVCNLALCGIQEKGRWKKLWCHPAHPKVKKQQGLEFAGGVANCTRRYGKERANWGCVVTLPKKTDIVPKCLDFVFRTVTTAIVSLFNKNSKTVSKPIKSL